METIAAPDLNKDISEEKNPYRRMMMKVLWYGISGLIIVVGVIWKWGISSNDQQKIDCAAEVVRLTQQVAQITHQKERSDSIADAKGNEVNKMWQDRHTADEETKRQKDSVIEILKKAK